MYFKYVDEQCFLSTYNLLTVIKWTLLSKLGEFYELLLHKFLQFIHLNFLYILNM